MMKIQNLASCAAMIGTLSPTAAAAGDPSAEVQPSFEQFTKTAIAGAGIPHAIPAPLQALWHAKAKQWETAHEIAQDIKTPTGSWIHAFLHREEGDLTNAGYWYRRAGKSLPLSLTIDQEWSFIAREIWHQEYGIHPSELALTASNGHVAEATAAEKSEEGSFHTMVHRQGLPVTRIESAVPISFSPSGDFLLLRQARADDDLRHLLVNLKTESAIISKPIGGRYVIDVKWTEDSNSVTLVYDPTLTKNPKEESFSIDSP